MHLSAKQNDTLVSELKSLVHEERKIGLEIVHYLKEVDSRAIYLEQGFPTLFEWAISVLGYSTGSAHRRIQAMRLLRVLPEMEEKISAGDLSFSVASQAQSFFKREDLLRREENKPRLTRDEKKTVVESLFGTSTRECERKLAAISPKAMLPEDKLKPLNQTDVLVQFVADQSLIDKLDALKGLLAHTNYEGNLSKLIDKIADMALERLKPKEPTAEEVQALEKNPVVASKSRNIPKSVKRVVWKRDQGRCTYQDPKTGKKCDSSHSIDFDHIIPYSWGGTHQPKNIQLLCSPHHAYRTKLMDFI
jgi:hypothetical protein